MAFVAPPESTAQVLLRIAIFYFGVLLVGAFLAFLVWHMLGAEAAPWPFGKLVNRATLFTAVVGLVVLVRQLQVGNLHVLGLRSLADAGWRRHSMGLFLGGLLVGLLMLGVLVWALLALGVRELDTQAWASGQRMNWLLRASVTGLVVAIWEEVLFRGVLLGALLRHAQLWRAAVLSALIYAALHFTRSQIGIVEPDWSSGLLLQLNALGNVLAWENLDSFLALFAAGVVLALLRAWSGSLWAPIGMHAGWVMVIYFSRKVTDEQTQSPWSWLIGNFDQIIGWLGFVGMTLMVIKLAWLARGQLSRRIL